MGKLKKLIFIALSSLFVFSFVGCTGNRPYKERHPDTGNNSGGTGDSAPIVAPDDNIKPPLTQPEDTPILGFADVGDKYSEAIKPMYDMACYIIEDLVADKYIELPDEYYNPRITALRYFNATNFWIEYNYDLYIGDKEHYTENTGVKSEFLERNLGVDLVNFTGSDESHDKYQNFLRCERKYEKDPNYVEIVSAMAQEVADAMLAEYETYKADPQIKILYFSKRIILRADSSLSEVHHKIIDKINQTLPLIRENPYNIGSHRTSVYPLVDYSRDVEIGLGKYSSESFTEYHMSVIVHFQNFRYQFYSMPFNSDGQFADNYICYMEGSPEWGWSGNDLYNPTNEEYIEFFEKLKIEEMTFPLEHSGKPFNYFTTLCNENTMLYFK